MLNETGYHPRGSFAAGRLAGNAPASGCGPGSLSLYFGLLPATISEERPNEAFKKRFFKVLRWFCSNPWDGTIASCGPAEGPRRPGNICRRSRDIPDPRNIRRQSVHDTLANSRSRLVGYSISISLGFLPLRPLFVPAKRLRGVEPGGTRPGLPGPGHGDRGGEFNFGASV